MRTLDLRGAGVDSFVSLSVYNLLNHNLLIGFLVNVTVFDVREVFLVFEEKLKPATC